MVFFSIPALNFKWLDFMYSLHSRQPQMDDAKFDFIAYFIDTQTLNIVHHHSLYIMFLLLCVGGFCVSKSNVSRLKEKPFEILVFVESFHNNDVCCSNGSNHSTTLSKVT